MSKSARSKDLPNREPVELVQLAVLELRRRHLSAGVGKR